MANETSANSLRELEVVFKESVLEDGTLHFNAQETKLFFSWMECLVADHESKVAALRALETIIKNYHRESK